MDYTMTLGQQLDPKNNSIGFLRLVSALLVIIGHSFPYGGFGEDPMIIATNNQVAIGRFPVDLFFALSGYLITASYLKSNSILVFIWHRFLRIYPAFWICIILTGLFVPLMFDLSPSFTYIKKNSALLTGITNHIKGLFVNKPGGRDVNSSLWTLPLECKAYLLIAAFGILKLLRIRQIVLATFLIVWLYFIYVILSNPLTDSIKTVGSWSRLFTYFLCGSCFYLYREKILVSRNLFIISLVSLMVIIVTGNYFHHSNINLYYIFSPVLFTYAVFWLSINLPFQKINVRNDVSYGIYIYGTLTLNILASLHLNSSYFLYLSETVAITLALAVLSWFLIEKPALRLKNVFTSANKSLAGNEFIKPA